MNGNDEYDECDSQHGKNDGIGDGKKGKRRSKNDTDGRDYQCQFCEKKYLSYPALYTHIKTKHSTGKNGEPLPALNSGRGRGRPKKNVSSQRE